jgi:hypothetical protein
MLYMLTSRCLVGPNALVVLVELWMGTKVDLHTT